MLSRQIGIGGVPVQAVAGIVAAVVRGSLRLASSCTSHSEAPTSRAKVIAERRSECGELLPRAGPGSAGQALHPASAILAEVGDVGGAGSSTRRTRGCPR
jgi:hypothetical protein